MSSPKTAIIGGGIAGLSAAWFLKEAGKTPTVFEATDHFGGKIISKRMEGCLLEGGPDSLLTEKPWALQLCRELGLESELLPSNDGQRSFSILHNQRLHPFPAGCKLFIPQKITPILTTPLLSPSGKARMLMEPFLKHRAPEGDESLADFTRRHFGQQTLDRLAGPLLGGIYGGDPEDMSMSATFPRLQGLEKKHGSLVKGMASMMRDAQKRSRAGTAPSLFTSLKSGMQILPDTLTSKLDGFLRPNHPVNHIQKTSSGWSVDGEDFEQLIIALPARHAATLFTEVDTSLSTLLSQQQSSSSATLSLVFDRKDLESIPSGFGFMSAHPLTSILVGCTWTGNKFQFRETENRFVCRLFLGGPDMNNIILTGEDHELIQPALDALRTICPFIPEQPLAHWLQRWPNGNPGYTLGHLDWVRKIKTQADTLGNLHFCGSSYGGVSVSDCVKQAQELVS
ncbi:protoporphyrinogen oxidase [Kiritimatiellaeota bacterium B1221]|nr:protoporphyrinogen oxidase [Kiritimatiellaeota bacterium B1221]